MLCPANAEDVKERYFENIIKNKGFTNQSEKDGEEEYWKIHFFHF